MEREITITVTDEEARRIDERVAAGEFASAAELAHAAVSSVLAPPDVDIPDDVLRQLLEEDDADDHSDEMTGEELRAHLHQYIDLLVARRDGKA